MTARVTEVGTFVPETGTTRLLTLRFVEYPPYEVAHPDEAAHADLYAPYPEYCNCCAIAELSETGERFLLWGAYSGSHWLLSREDPRWGTDDRIEVAELLGAPAW